MTFGEFELHDVPLQSEVSFLDFDGVVTFAGSFERSDRRYSVEETICIAPADLDLRERELVTLLQQHKPILFLVNVLPIGLHISPQTDLFRRIAQKFRIQLAGGEHSTPFVESCVPEFADYVRRFGTGYVTLFPSDKYKEDFTSLCIAENFVFGTAWANKLFILPSAVPERVKQVPQIVASAILGVLEYRRRMSRALPDWVSGFSFSKEAELREKATELHMQAAKFEAEVDTYATFKGALCLQSDPLVETVRKLLQNFFAITLKIDDKCIEDATLNDGEGNIMAVFEIKGVKGNFTRNQVNQVDSHRERLNIPSSKPGVLIVNTMLSALSLSEKDERPHPDIIKKAAADNVLLIRTLDLLRYSDAVERGVLTRESFRATILGNAGWLRVESDNAAVIRK